MQLSDFKNLDSKTTSLVRRALKKWNPRVEARVIELFNQGLSQSDVNKIIRQEGLFEVPTSITKKTGVRKFDFRGVNAIYEQLLKDGKLDPSIKKIDKTITGKYATAAEIATQDREILNHYLKNEARFEGKPANQIVKSFNSEYGLKTGTNIARGNAISANSVRRAFNNAIDGKYPELDEYFKARPLDEFIVSRHANIFPDVNKLDKLVKNIINSGDNYLIDERVNVIDRMKRLREDYARVVGINPDDPSLENNFTARIRKLLNRYGGNNVERYEKKLFDTIKAPQGYIDSNLHKNLIAIAGIAGKMSNKDVALQLGLPLEDVKLIEKLKQGTYAIGKKYKMPLVKKGDSKLYLAGDHTDIKALMQNFPEYKKNFMRIAFIQDGLNTIKATYDKKILALKRLADQGIKFDEGPKRSDIAFDLIYDKKTGERIYRPVKFNPKIHVRKKTGVSVGKRTLGPFSGPLTASEKAAGGRTIPDAIAKLQKEFFDLSGGYKLGGFDIVDGKAVAPKNFIQPRINERASPLSMTLRETLNNLQYGTKDMKTVPNKYLNVVDKAIISPEGATTEGRVNILKRFEPKDLKGSGYLEALRVTGDAGTKQSQTISNVMNQGLRKAFENNEDNICSIFGKANGGSVKACLTSFDNAVKNNPQGLFQKVLNFVKSPGPKTFGIGAGVGAAIGLVKAFRNDDPTTYLSNEDQQKNMLVDMATQPISLDTERPAILDYQLPALGASLAASTALAAPSTIRASRSTKQFASRAEGIERKKPTGPVKTGLRVLGRGLGVAASPALLAPFAAGDIASQIAEGDSPADIATNPFNYLYPAFADQTPKLTRGLSPTLRKFARLGLGRAALTGLSRAGIAGLGASLAIQGLGLLDD